MKYDPERYLLSANDFRLVSGTFFKKQENQWRLVLLGTMGNAPPHRKINEKKKLRKLYGAF